ncbi:MAG: transporter substrate-binding domain-containing protein, partial [Synergistaceae bacterium]|nr:transporter substrate-binding domain-containing protein [Synergistaceae bacterium]
FLAFTAALVVASSVYAAVVMTARVGFLTRLNTNEEEFSRIIQDSTRTTGWNLLSNRHELYGVKFYDSLNTMLMAMDKYEIDEIALPDVVAEYITANNPAYEICCLAQTRVPMSLAFGFRKDETQLAWKFDRVIQEMNDDWTLPEIQGVYIYNNNRNKPVSFDSYDGAETVKVAVTGDLPPLDYVDEGGRASGFNTAILAEIGRRLKVNIELVNIESGARNAALSSGRVDVVFWYETSEGGVWNFDAPEGVLLSKPYYSWNKFYHITKKQTR